MFYRQLPCFTDDSMFYLHHRLGIFCPDPHTDNHQAFCICHQLYKEVKGFLGIEYDEINKMKIRNSANK